MWPENSDTMSPMPGASVSGRPARLVHTSETRSASSTHTVSGGPSRGSLGRVTGNVAICRACSSVTCWPSPRSDPGGPGDGDGVGDCAIGGDGEALGAFWVDGDDSDGL